MSEVFNMVGGGGCPRAEADALFDFGALTDSEMSWTVTAIENE